MDKIKTIKEALEYIPEYIDLLESILKSGDCNNCARVLTCKYAPGWGEPVRYNCPHYEAEEIACISPINRVITNVECPVCKRPMWKRVDMILASNPLKYQYECDCGQIEYRTE